MSEENSVRWLCHRCAKKEGIITDIDPIIGVCVVCKIENWVRPVRGAPVVVEVLKEAPESEPEPEPVIEVETVEVEPEDPYQGMTTEELKAELAKRG